jgi:hypothetical protein
MIRALLQALLPCLFKKSRTRKRRTFLLLW